MKPVFLDTVGLLAIWDADDQWHQPAVVAYGHLTTEKAVLVTTSYVIAECGNAAARRPYRQAVADFRRALEVRRATGLKHVCATNGNEKALPGWLISYHLP